jgi:cytidine deaminase
MMKKENNKITDEKLIRLARDVSVNSYSPHSRFRVGAAILTEDNKVFTGTNVEFDSFSLTICAERAALFSAVSSGYRKFSKIAIAVSTDEIKYPCGLCRQALAEFSPDMTVILSYGKKICKIKLNKLIPLLFKLDRNKR